MSSVGLHFASGGAFFSGSACLLAGLLIVALARRRWFPRLGRFLILSGLFLIVASATPLPAWFWCVWGSALVFWGMSRFVGAARAPKGNSGQPPCTVRKSLKMAALAAVVGCTVAAGAWELQYQLPPQLPAGSWNRLVIIGDSLSAEDFTEGGDPWPKLLAREHKFDVLNLAFSGAKAGSAEPHVAPEQVADALVVLEIGGNDVLGGTTPAQFEQDLGRLLQKVCRADNAVVMLELPLPPLYNRFGDIQRRLARRHHVLLIPKRYFAGVLGVRNATVDGLHLSHVGHQKMAAMIFTILSPSMTRIKIRYPKSSIRNPPHGPRPLPA